MASFADLKKATSNLKEMTEKLNQEKTGGYSKDDRFWNLEVDKAGNGYAVIRYLPAPVDHDMPMVKVYSHAFKVGNKWFIEECPTTIGQPCPVCEANAALWETGTEANKKTASNRKRGLKYIGNILVVSDPKNPDNDGKRFLFKYGKLLFGMITNAISPSFQDEVAFNPYDFWTGANFKLKAKNVSDKPGVNFRDLGKSEFEAPSALLGGDDEALEELWRSEYSLKEFLDPSRFKSYEALDKKFKSLFVTSSVTSSESSEGYTAPENFVREQPIARRPSVQVPSKADKLDDDDDMSAYSKLLDDDDDIPF